MAVTRENWRGVLFNIGEDWDRNWGEIFFSTVGEAGLLGIRPLLSVEDRQGQAEQRMQVGTQLNKQFFDRCLRCNV